MPNNKLNDLALYYFVDDLPGALIPATRLTTILERCHQSLPLTRLALVYLEKQGLQALHQHAQGNSAIDEFRRSAKEEQFQRKQTAEMKQRTLEAARQAQINLMQEKAKAARQALESDPKYIAKVRNQKLRARYYLDYFIERDCFHTLMDILRRVDAGNRLTEKDILWLLTTGKDYYSDHLKSAYHCIEAKFYVSKFKKSQDPWMAINASSHYRKADKSAVADKLLCAIDIEKKKSPKIKSAFYTTHGGVKRDLKLKDEALNLGKKAHLLMGKDFRPCTLIGAVYMETACYDLGQEWYAKAVERGASKQAIDSDLRSIFMRAEKATQNKMRLHLLEIDPIRYSWAKSARSKRSSKC